MKNLLLIPVWLLVVIVFLISVPLVYPTKSSYASNSSSDGHSGGALADIMNELETIKLLTACNSDFRFLNQKRVNFCAKIISTTLEEADEKSTN